MKSYASRGAPTSSPSLPCFFESASGGNQIRHTATSVFALRYARYIADAEINGFWFQPLNREPTNLTVMLEILIQPEAVLNLFRPEIDDFIPAFQDVIHIAFHR